MGCSITKQEAMTFGGVVFRVQRCHGFARHMFLCALVRTSADGINALHGCARDSTALSCACLCPVASRMASAPLDELSIQQRLDRRRGGEWRQMARPLSKTATGVLWCRSTPLMCIDDPFSSCPRASTLARACFDCICLA